MGFLKEYNESYIYEKIFCTLFYNTEYLFTSGSLFIKGTNTVMMLLV